MLETHSNRLSVNLKLLIRFFSKIKIDPNVSFNGVPCWLWTAGKDKNGYAKFSPAHSETVRAQRFVYETFVAIIDPPELTTDHLCRVKPCVNPVHLEAVTGRVNTLRSNNPFAQNARRTHCKHGHEFTPENTYYAPGRPNRRLCKQCQRQYDHDHPRDRAAYQREQRRLHPERFRGYRKKYQGSKNV